MKIKHTPNKHNVKIGDRLEISAEEIMLWLKTERTNYVTVREDLTIRMNPR